MFTTFVVSSQTPIVSPEYSIETRYVNDPGVGRRSYTNVLCILRHARSFCSCKLLLYLDTYTPRLNFPPFPPPPTPPSPSSSINPGVGRRSYTNVLCILRHARLFCSCKLLLYLDTCTPKLPSSPPPQPLPLLLRR